MDEVEDQFSAGVNAYWSGRCPEGWNNVERRNKTPYLMGWYMASIWETEPGTLLDEDGDPIQDAEDY